MTKKLGRYRLVEPLGQGGMGEVFSAVHEGIGGFERKVCVKVMKPELADNPRAVELFLREARLAARLSHPNIVQIFELGREQGTYFLAMELLDGLPWHDIAQRCWRHGKVLPLEVIIGACADAADALSYAHTLSDREGRVLGMVHRDVSPDNLFLTRDGGTKVLDFGIAKAMSLDATRLTEKGELRGKLPYMPPEQVKTDDVDGRADIWALGVTLFYLSTAQRPFDRETPLQTMTAILKEPAISARDMNPALPRAFADVIALCLEKSPAARWPSARAVRDALLGLLPRPPDVNEARALLALAERLERGDRRPLSALPAAPAWSSWKPSPPASKPATAAHLAEATLVGDEGDDPSAPRTQQADADAATVQRHEAVSSTQASLSEQATQAAPRVEKTMVTAPLLTADESSEDSSDPGDAPGFDEARTVAEIGSLMGSGGPSAEVLARAEPTVAVSMSQLGLAADPPPAEPTAAPVAVVARPPASGSPSPSLSPPPAPPSAQPRLPPRSPLTQAPVWLIAVAAFVATLLLAGVVLGLVALLR